MKRASCLNWTSVTSQRGSSSPLHDRVQIRRVRGRQRRGFSLHDPHHHRQEARSLEGVSQTAHLIEEAAQSPAAQTPGFNSQSSRLQSWSMCKHLLLIHYTEQTQKTFINTLIISLMMIRSLAAYRRRASAVTSMNLLRVYQCDDGWSRLCDCRAGGAQMGKIRWETLSASI